MTTRMIGTPLAAVLASMICFQVGASLAKSLFPALGPVGTTSGRLAIAALLLCLIYRPWRGLPRGRDAQLLLAFGLSLAGLNTFSYLALERLPQGVTIAVQFLGPLGVALVASRKVLDFLWIALAAGGLLLLAPLSSDAPLDRTGIGLALAAAACWAGYIVFGKALGHLHPGRSAALATIIAAIAVAPFGLAGTGGDPLRTSILPVLLIVAILSSAIPYALELFALRHLPVRTFGTLMSAEPALGALSGIMILGEYLTATEWLAILMIIMASAGAASTARSIRCSPTGDADPPALPDNRGS